MDCQLSVLTCRLCVVCACAVPLQRQREHHGEQARALGRPEAAGPTQQPLTEEAGKRHRRHTFTHTTQLSAALEPTAVMRSSVHSSGAADTLPE